MHGIVLDDFKIIASILKLVPTDNLVTWCCSNKQQHTRFKLLGDILVMAEKLAASVATAHAYFTIFSMKATGKK